MDVFAVRDGIIEAGDIRIGDWRRRSLGGKFI
jgi:hypothetical protein